MRHHTRSAAAIALAAAALTGVVAGPAAADTVGPVVRSVTVSSPLVDVTRATAYVTVTLRLTDVDGFREGYVQAIYARDASADPNSGPTTGELDSIELTRVSGTATDGTYRAAVPALGGTKGSWGLQVQALDVRDNETVRTAVQLAASGLTSGFRSTTTAPPQAPRWLDGKTDVYGGFPALVVRRVSWTMPAGSPKAAGWKIDAANNSCGKRPELDIRFADLEKGVTQLNFYDATVLVPCRVTLRLANAAGVSAPVTVVFV